VVARFNPGGALDSSFGNGGTVTTQFPGVISTAGQSNAFTALVQSDGKILVGGAVRPCANPRNSRCVTQTVLARYNTDGTLDGTFGSGGIAETSVQGSFGVIALGEDATGDIFALDGISVGHPLVTEFSPAGAPMPQVAPAPSITVASPNGLRPDGSYAVGQAASGGRTRDGDTQVVKFLSPGTVDPNFTNPPFDFTAEGANGGETTQALAFQTDGKVIAAGEHSFNGSAEIGVARLNADGSLDTTFGAGGALTLSQGEQASAIAIQPDGKILIAGEGTAGITLARLLG
jgi:uncharacterized delta-60 repeat protein